MTSKRALITGISGQDGSYLAQALLEQGYEVLGILETGRSSSLWNLDYLGVLPRIRLLKATLADSVEVQRLLLETKPSEIYSLAAQSSVSASFREPALTMTTNTQPVLNWLEAIRSLNPSIRFYQASSSEMYGNVEHACVTPTTLFNPISPYAVSKVAAHQLVRAYRNAYGLYAVSGILFNHESALRKPGFFTRKLMDGALGLASQQITALSFGNLDVQRDFGYAPDYVQAMWLMLRQVEPEDHLICSGQSVSLKAIASHVFQCLNISLDALHIDASLYRPAEIQDIFGTPDYATSKLGWSSANNAFQTMERILEERLRMQQRHQRLPA